MWPSVMKMMRGSTSYSPDIDTVPPANKPSWQTQKAEYSHLTCGNMQKWGFWRGTLADQFQQSLHCCSLVHHGCTCRARPACTWNWQYPLLATAVWGPQMVWECAHMCVCVCACECVCMYVYGMNLKCAVCCHIHISFHSVQCQCTHTHTHTLTHSHTHTHTHTCMHTFARTQAHIRMHMRAHTRTHTHTHSYYLRTTNKWDQKCINYCPEVYCWIRPAWKQKKWPAQYAWWTKFGNSSYLAIN